MLKGGWTGKILWVDLTKKKYVIESYDESLALNYIGGRGFTIRLLWDYLPRGLDPLSPDNLLIFAVGPLTGLPIPSSGKMVIAGKSPLTGGYGDGNVGTRAAVNLKKVGFDVIVVKGKADKPTYIYITKNGVEFHDASDLWGLDTGKIHDELSTKYGRTAGILTIGVGGEKLVRFATVISEKDRAGGRPGMGALMGSKNLKAVVIDSEGEFNVYDLDEVKRLGAEGYKEIKSSELYEAWMKEGTMAILKWCQEHSVLPTYNFREGVFEEADKITGQVMAEQYKVFQKGCPNCNMVCGNVAEGKGEYSGIRAEVDYENVAMLGPNIGIGDFSKIIALIRRVDELGLDAISTGSVIGFTIEAYKRGFIKDKDLDGLRPDWGDIDTANRIIDLILEGKGLGRYLKLGTRVASRALGGEASDFAMQVKGLETSAYNCHIAYGMALAFGTSPIGAHHKDAWFITRDISIGIDDYSEEKVKQVIWMQHVRGGMFETLVTCRLPWIELNFNLEWYPKFLKAATGIEFTLDYIYTVAERIYALIRLFWIREYGYWNIEMDIPPKRWFKDPLTVGPHKGRVLNLDNYITMLKTYYRLRGWDDNGIPRLSKLKELGLEREAASLKNLGIEFKY